VGAALGVQAGFGEREALHGPAVEEMLVDDLVDVFGVNEAVPDGVGIDDDNGAVLALVEAAELVSADFAFETSLLDRVLEGILQLFATLAGAAWAGCVFVALIGADEEVVLELRQWEVFLFSGTLCAAQRFLRQYKVDAT
jgi:hypothetical protein